MLKHIKPVVITCKECGFTHKLHPRELAGVIVCGCGKVLVEQKDKILSKCADSLSAGFKSNVKA